MNEINDGPQRRGATMADVARIKDPAATTPAEALRMLQEGNSRFYSGTPRSMAISANERRAQIMAQTPFAVVLGCADSRVPVEMIFDVGPGDLFSIRVAGNIVEQSTLGSIEYAVENLKVHLVVVLGHEGCGAVTAAMSGANESQATPENVAFLLERIVPAVCDLSPIRDGKARMREAVISNVRYQVDQLLKNPVIKAAIACGKIQVIGAFYEIGSGAVDFLNDED
jgi:carbonic anhydrase